MRSENRDCLLGLHIKGGKGVLSQVKDSTYMLKTLRISQNSNFVWEGPALSKQERCSIEVGHPVFESWETHYPLCGSLNFLWR